MVCHMKTTLNIDDTLMKRLRELAARRGTTMTALVEAGLRRILGEDGALAIPPDDLPPLPGWRMGKPLVDVADREALYDLLEKERDRRLYGTFPDASGGDRMRERALPVERLALSAVMDSGPETPYRVTVEESGKADDA